MSCPAGRGHAISSGRRSRHRWMQNSIWGWSSQRYARDRERVVGPWERADEIKTAESGEDQGSRRAGFRRISWEMIRRSLRCRSRAAAHARFNGCAIMRAVSRGAAAVPAR